MPMSITVVCQLSCRTEIFSQTASSHEQVMASNSRHSKHLSRETTTTCYCIRCTMHSLYRNPEVAFSMYF